MRTCTRPRSARGNGGREPPAVGDRELRPGPPGRHRIDEIGLDHERRMLQHPARDLGLIDRQAKDHDQRRVLAEGERARKRRAHQRRRIVEQHDQRAFASRAIIGRQIGIEIGARERCGRFRPLGSAGGTHPLQKLTNDHGSTPTLRESAAGQHGYGVILRSET